LEALDARIPQMSIRKSGTLPSAQHVNFSSQLDILLSEIVRIK
jgi:hypothetical protein